MAPNLDRITENFFWVAAYLFRAAAKLVWILSYPSRQLANLADQVANLGCMFAGQWLSSFFNRFSTAILY